MNAPASPPSSSSPNGAAPPGSTPAGGSPDPTIADVLKSLEAFKADVDGRLKATTKDLLGVRADFARVKGQGRPVADEHQPPPPAPVTQDDLTAAMRLGEVKAGLPEKARARIDALTAEGRSYRDALAFAETLAETISQVQGSVTPPVSGQPASVTPRVAVTGSSATPAHSPVVSLPGTLEELKAIALKDPLRFKAIMATDGFDPYKLPPR